MLELVVVTLLILIGGTLLVSSARVLKEHERIVMFRLGKYMGVRGPGLVFSIPFVDKIHVVDLNTSVPGWQGLSSAQIEEIVASHVFPGGMI